MTIMIESRAEIQLPSTIGHHLEGVKNFVSVINYARIEAGWSYG
jgi:hypothetical protein